MKRPVGAVACLSVALCAALLAACRPLELAQLYFQEKQYVTDQELIAKVRGSLIGDERLDATQIEVDAYLRDVTLRGSVASPAERARALALAQDIAGVESVTSELEVSAGR